jgi:hypothetical protein
MEKIFDELDIKHPIEEKLRHLVPPYVRALQ